VLEEVQVPVALGDRVVDRMFAGHARGREPGTRGEIHADRQGARLGIEVCAGTYQRGVDSSAASNSFSVIGSNPSYDKVPESTHSDFNRGSVEFQVG